MHRRPVTSRTSILAIGAIGSVRAISACRGIIRIYGAHRAARAVYAIGAVETAGAAAAKEIRCVVVVIAHGNVDLCLDAWMAGRRDRDMRQLPVADSGIGRK